MAGTTTGRARRKAGRRAAQPAAEAPAEAVRRLLAAKGRHSLELGRALARMDLAERRAIADDAETRLSLRSIYYLVSVATAVDQGLITEDQIREVSWSRARALVEGVLTGRMKPVSKAALARAKRTPARLLTYRDPAAAAAKPRLKTLVFALTEAQAEAVEAALARFGASAAATPPERGAALSEICTMVLGAAGAAPRGGVFRSADSRGRRERGPVAPPRSPRAQRSERDHGPRDPA